MTVLDRRTFLGAVAVAPALLGSRQASAGPNDHDKLVMAARGQISNADLRAADVYYWSSEITNAVRNDWNAYVAKHRNVWNASHPRKDINVNSKTRAAMGGYNHWPWVEPSTVEKVAYPLGLSQDGVLRFRHREGTRSDSAPLRNFRKVSLVLRRRASHAKWDTKGSGFDYHQQNVDYETGFTFWQGGTPKWMNRGTPGALWQVHTGSTAVIYLQVSSTGHFSGFTRAKPGASTQHFPTFRMTAKHEDIHVLRVRYRLGSGSYLRIWYNGNLMVNLARPMTGFSTPFQMFMNYRSDTGAKPERILYMDRCYSKAV